MFNSYKFENCLIQYVHHACRYWDNLKHYLLFLNFVIFRSVSRAVQNLVQPDLLQSQAVDVRMELDLRIGKF